jgi:putative transposase
VKVKHRFRFYPTLPQERSLASSLAVCYVYNCGVTRYARNSSAVFSLKFHLVWCPKYRRPVLTDALADRLKALLLEKADEFSLTIHAMEIMPDHVHLFLECDPTFSVAEITNRLKGYTSRILRQEFRLLRSRLPTLWSRSTTQAASVTSARPRFVNT